MVLTERRGSVMILTLNNLAQYNALAGSLMGDLREALDGAIGDATVRAILLTGAGKGFAPGRNWAAETRSARESRWRGHARLDQSADRKNARRAQADRCGGEWTRRGAGVGIALAGDIVVAARSARFILSFVRLGAALDAGTSLFLQRSIGIARARALALLGQPLTAEKAEQWGLIWKMVEDGELLNEALAIAQGLADGPPVSLGLIKNQYRSRVEFIPGLDA